MEMGLISVVAAGIAGCKWIPEEENAKIVIEVVESKSLDTPVDDYVLSVSGEDKTYYQGRFADRPSALEVPAGGYLATLTSGKFDTAQFDAPQLGDSKNFTLEAGETATVTLNCTLQNAGLRIKVTENFKAAYPDGPLHLTQNETTLEYPYGCEGTAYFKEGDVFISYDGEIIAVRSLEKGVVEVLELDAEKAGAGVSFSVTIDDSFKEKTSSALIGSAPELSVAQAKGLPLADSLKACVCGYIVGGVKNNKVVKAGTEGYDISANILLADNPADSTLAACMPVELKTQALQSALSLSANPSLAGRKVQLCGTILPYFSTSGLKSVTNYLLK